MRPTWARFDHRGVKTSSLGAVVVLLLASLFLTPPASARTPSPQVRHLSVTTGPAAGGTRVSVAGRHFTRRSRVLFGGTPARTSYRSASKLIAISPPHAAGTVDVVVRNGRHRSGASARDRFTFVAPAPAPTATRWARVSAGDSHACAVGTDGSLWCWGSNSKGQLGTAANAFTSNKNPAPMRVGSSTAWVLVDAGHADTCGIQTDHTLWCWGDNAAGELGDPMASTAQTSTPTRVGTRADWVAVSVGLLHVCALTSGGTLWCWGDNHQGELGNAFNVGTHIGNPVPTQVGTATTWASVASGEAHTCATRTDATLWCWGDNEWGELGVATNNGTLNPNSSPIQVGSGTAWSAVVVGREHSCATATTGAVWCWGDGSGGATPTQVGAGTSWHGVASGYDHNCAIDPTGALACWGANFYGQLGNAAGVGAAGPPNQTPVRVGTSTWTQADLGYAFTCAVRSDATLWCWGKNDAGQLGTSTNAGSLDANPAPMQVLN